MARSVLLNLLGNESSATRALRNVGDEADRTAGRLDSLDDAGRRADGGGNRLTAMLTRLAPAAGQAATSIGLAAAGLGAAIPVAAGLTAVLVQVAPAAAVAATGIAAIGLAGVALKVGMSGVGDAISAALDPSDPEAYAAALAKLSPAARAFVGEIHQLQPAFAAIKTAVQDTLFAGLDKSFANAARTTLPIFRQGLVGAADALNGMGKGLLATIESLGKAGTLKGLFSGATDGLANLERVPGQILKGFVELGAAAAPMFERMTAAIGAFADRASKGFSEAFKSGAVEGAINTAVGLLKQLAAVGGNVAEILGNVFGAAQASGGGFVGVLQTVTGELAKITAGADVQGGLKALFATMQQLATTAAPLLGIALQAIGGVLQALGPPAQTLIAALGEGLRPIFEALGPVLVAAATAVGNLVVAFAPLLPVLGQLIAGVLPILTPFITALGQAFTLLAPIVQQLATTLQTALAPILAQLPAIAQPLADVFTQFATNLLPVLGEMVTALSPSLVALGTAFGQLLVAVAPLLAVFAQLTGQALAALVPILTPIIQMVGQLAAVLANQLAKFITGVVIPAITGLVALLRGDFSTAWDSVRTAAVNMIKSLVENFVLLPVKIAQAIAPLVPTLLRAAVSAGAQFVRATHDWALKAVQFLASLPGKMLRALGSLGSLLVSAGRSLMQGLINGITSMIGSLTEKLAGITALIPKVKGPPEKDAVLLRPAGIAIMDGLIGGISSRIPALGKKLGDVTRSIGDTIGRASTDLIGRAETWIPIIDIGARLRKALMGTADQIGAAVKEIAKKIRDAFKAGDITKGDRDGLLDMLFASNKKLQKLSEERQKILDKIKEARDYAKKIMTEALSFAAITNIKTEGGGTPTGGELVAGLQAKLAQIRAFSGNIKKLAQAGLSKSLLRQILDAGIDGGSAIAAELANGPNSIIAALNAAQTTIEKVAKGLGLNAADLLFDSGKNAGAGFLKGLESMQQTLLKAMEKLITALLKALGVGVDKFKEEMAKIGTIQVDWKINAPKPYNPVAVAAPTPKPYLPVAAPKPQLSLASVASSAYKSAAGSSGIRPVNINLGPTTFRETMDVELALNAAAFKARALTF